MHHKKLEILNAQMLVVRNFIDEFYNKTLRGFKFEVQQLVVVLYSAFLPQRIPHVGI